MSRLSRNLAGLVALAGLIALAAAPADAKTKRRHAPAPRPAPAASFPTYIDRGVDRNPGGDNLYFSDTKTNHYIVGPAWFQRWSD